MKAITFYYFIYLSHLYPMGYSKAAHSPQFKTFYKYKNIRYKQLKNPKHTQL